MSVDFEVPHAVALRKRTDVAGIARTSGLAQAHERAERLLEAIARREPRLGRYRERLAAALERADEGTSEWVSGVHCDSYHTVWFELHEDLLRMLDRQRED